MDCVTRAKIFTKDIIENFDPNCLCDWYDSITLFFTNPISELPEYASYYAEQIKQYDRFFNLLYKANLLEKLCNFYFYEFRTNEYWINVCNTENSVAYSNFLSADLKPRAKQDCYDKIREIIISGIVYKDIEIYPLGKENKKGEYIFFKEGKPKKFQNLG